MPYMNDRSDQRRRAPAQQPPPGGAAPARRQQERQGQPPRQRGPETPPQRRRRAPRVKYRWFRALVMVMAAIAGSGFLALFILQSASDLFGLNQPDHAYNITVPPNADLGQVADILTETGVVDKNLTFRLYAGLKFKEGDKVNPGEYIFNSNMGYDQIILLLKRGISSDQIVELTFIEGMTLNEIAVQLEEEKVCERAAFLEYLQTADFNYEFFNQLPENENRFYRLEGYIFPDTYQFYVGEKVSSVVKKFLDNFQKRISDDMIRRMQSLNMTLDQTIALASVIQKEAGMESQMRRVSSVFHNRLNNPGAYPQLQSDVTILYVEKDIKPYLKITNQTMYDAYNTYVTNGLPVGAICNPGLEAIMAALYPAETEYYFFVTDVNMEFYYASTLQEHSKNIRIAAQADETGMGQVHGVDTQ